MASSTKQRILAPCGYINEDGKHAWPAVDCEYNCEACGWNPKEAKRRVEEGKRKLTLYYPRRELV